VPGCRRNLLQAFTFTTGTQLCRWNLNLHPKVFIAFILVDFANCRGAEIICDQVYLRVVLFYWKTLIAKRCLLWQSAFGNESLLNTRMVSPLFGVPPVGPL
jgi:hypothetical protein